MRATSMTVWASLLVIAFLSIATTVAAQTVPWKLVMQFPAVDAEVKVKAPVFLGLDSEKQRYYLVDAGDGKLVSFDREGTLLASFDAAGQLTSPVSMARTSTGKLWIVERSKNQLLYVDIGKKLIKDFTLKDKKRELIVPDRIQLDEKDRLFVLDRLNGEILQVDDNVQIAKRYAPTSETQGLCDFKVKTNGIYALGCLDRKVYRFSFDGSLEKTVSLGRDMLFPAALEVEGTDRIYILDRHKGRINVFDGQGEFKFDFLDKGKRSGLISYGAFLMLDWDNRLCVVEEGNGRVEIYGRQ